MEAVLDWAETLNRVNLVTKAIKFADVLPLGEVETLVDGRAKPEAARARVIEVGS